MYVLLRAYHRVQSKEHPGTQIKPNLQECVCNSKTAAATKTHRIKCTKTLVPQHQPRDEECIFKDSSTNCASQPRLTFAWRYSSSLTCENLQRNQLLTVWASSSQCSLASCRPVASTGGNNVEGAEGEPVAPTPRKNKQPSRQHRGETADSDSSGRERQRLRRGCL